MARLNPDQIRKYQEEQEYHEENKTVHLPGKPSALERIRNSVNQIPQKAQEFDRGAAGQGLRSWAARSNATQGLGGGQPPNNYARFNNAPANNQQQPVNQGSVLHPGNRLYVIQGSMIASGGGTAREPRPRRQSRPVNPGFGNDPGL